MATLGERDQLSLVDRQQKWASIPRIARTIPFGYEPDPDNADLLVPVELELEALEMAKKYLRQYSYREVARWLTETTNRYISHMGLKKRLESERRRRSKANTLKAWSRKYEEARAKVEAFESARLGAREDQ